MTVQVETSGENCTFKSMSRSSIQHQGPTQFKDITLSSNYIRNVNRYLDFFSHGRTGKVPKLFREISRMSASLHPRSLWFTMSGMMRGMISHVWSSGTTQCCPRCCQKPRQRCYRVVRALGIPFRRCWGLSGSRGTVVTRCRVLRSLMFLVTVKSKKTPEYAVSVCLWLRDVIFGMFRIDWCRISRYSYRADSAGLDGWTKRLIMKPAFSPSRMIPYKAVSFLREFRRGVVVFLILR